MIDEARGAVRIFRVTVRLPVIITVLFVQTCLTKRFLVPFAVFFSAAGALVILFSFGITGFSGFVNVL